MFDLTAVSQLALPKGTPPETSQAGECALLQDPQLQLLRAGSAHQARCAALREMEHLTFARSNPPATTLEESPPSSKLAIHLTSLSSQPGKLHPQQSAGIAKRGEGADGSRTQPWCQ